MAGKRIIECCFFRCTRPTTARSMAPLPGGPGALYQELWSSIQGDVVTGLETGA